MEEKERLAQKQYDLMTKTPVFRLLVKLSIPTVISMLITNIYNLADTAFIGRIGTSASGAVGVVFGFMAIIQAVSFMFGHGAGSHVSRFLGQKDMESASKIASTAFFDSLVVCAVIMILGYVFTDELVMLLGSTKTIAPYAVIYVRYILFAIPAIVTSFIMNNFLRYEGRAYLGTIGMMVGAILNIIGDPILIFGFKMGIAGAGLSTAISQYIGFFVLISVYLRGKTQVTISPKYYLRSVKATIEIITTGMPSLFRQGLNSIVTVLLNSSAGIYGDYAVSAMSIVARVVFIALCVAIGVGQGFQPISGYNYGAGKYGRLRKAFWCTVLLSTVLVIFISLGLLIDPEFVVSRFRDDPQVIMVGARALRLNAYVLWTTSPCMVVEMLFQSTGRKLGASIMSVFRSGALFVPVLLILREIRGIYGIQEAQPIAYVISAIPAIFFGVHYFANLPRKDEE